MKATGIVRRIDDLGRVVIPKEIRRTMHIREGDNLEIYTSRDGEVIFKKYSPVGEMGEGAELYASAVAKAFGINYGICDRDTVTAVAGKDKKAVAGKGVSPVLASLMENRKSHTAEDAGIAVTEDGSGNLTHFCPITYEGDVVGGVFSFCGDTFSPATDSDKGTVSAGAIFLSSRIQS